MRVTLMLLVCVCVVSCGRVVVLDPQWRYWYVEIPDKGAIRFEPEAAKKLIQSIEAYPHRWRGERWQHYGSVYGSGDRGVGAPLYGIFRSGTAGTVYLRRSGNRWWQPDKWFALPAEQMDVLLSRGTVAKAPKAVAE